MPFAKGTKLSEAHRLAISEGRKRRKAELGYLNSPETREKQRQAKIGKKLTPEHCAKLSEAMKGRRPANFEMAIAAAHAAPKKRGEDSPGWKGDDVGYYALHTWVTKNKGRPSICEECGTDDAKRYEWANISGDYLRDLDDFRRLCVSCHRKEGYARGEYPSPSLRCELKET